MTYFPQNPISQPNRFGAPPRNPREAADAIMAYLDREAAGAAMPRAPFAPFLAETYEPPEVGGEGGYAATVPNATSYAFEPFGDDEEGEADLPLPYPNAQSDDERIENVMWLLERKPVDPFSDTDDTSGESIGLDSKELSELLGTVDVAGGPYALFAFLAMAAHLRRMRLRQARKELLNQRRKSLQQLEPENPLLEKIRSDRPPRLSELQRLEREMEAARGRALNHGVELPSQLGESVDTIGGRAVHNLFSDKARLEKAQREVPVEGGRIDRVDIDLKNNTAEGGELKPNNRRAIGHAERQNNRNATAHEKKTGKPTTPYLQVYDKSSALDWLLGWKRKK